MTAREKFDLVLVGSGFASAFFLFEYLKHCPQNAKILVLEMGQAHEYAWQLENRRHSNISSDAQIVNLTPQKPWVYNLAFGGGSCWTGNTPRMHPSDFRTRTLYGVGDDWPIDYDTLEPYYVVVEEEMGIAGASGGPFPRSKPYPMPPHRLNALDEAFAAKYPGLYLPMPSARPTEPYRGRSACCGNGVCSTCPIGAKFQVDLHMKDSFSDPRVTVRLGARVNRLEISGGLVRGVHYEKNNQGEYVECEVAAVGANALITPWILQRSGLSDEALGRYLNEQIGVDINVMLSGIQNYGGSQATTGFGVMFLDGEFRKKRAGCLLENWNAPWLRAEAGRWRERGYFKLVFEGIPLPENRVVSSKDHPDKPVVEYQRHSEYMKAGFAAVPELLDELFEGLPIESYEVLPHEDLSTDAHIQGTVRMGKSDKTSVVDATLRHHKTRNLLALGSGVFPTCPAANPTLTLSALSVMAARRLFNEARI